MPGPMLAAIDEGAIRQQMRGVANFPRCRNPARLGHELDTGGDIDGIAEDRLGLVDDDLAEMQPDAEHQALFLVERLVEARHPFLDVDAAATAATAELNSASTESPTMFTIRPPAASTAGRHTPRVPT